MLYPDRWGQGSLFAYSGLDGRCTLREGMVGSLLDDAMGVLFHKPLRRELRFPLHGVRDLHHLIVASDIIESELVERRGGARSRLLVLFVAEAVVAGETTEAAAPLVVGDLAGTEATSTRDASGTTLTVHREQRSAGGSALLTRPHAGRIRFAFSASGADIEGAVDAARRVLDVDLDAEAERRRRFFVDLPAPPRGTRASWERTLAKCFSVMKCQVYSPEGKLRRRWTTPDRIPHQKIWLWDSAFHSLGNRHISAELARDTLDAVLDMQRDSGFIPVMDTPEGEEHDETQPPVLAWAYLELYHHCGRRDILESCYGPLRRYLTWNDANRDADHNDLYEWKIRPDDMNCRCGESGMDNSPRFDPAIGDVDSMDCIDFSCFMAREAESMAEIAGLLGRLDEARAWREKHARIASAVNGRLWDERDGLYYDRTLATGELRRVRSVASFLPLFAGVCDQDRARRLVGHLGDPASFGTEVPVPSIAVSDPTYGSDMWRGPVWINYNYMIVLGLERYGFADLAGRLARRTLEAVSFWYDHDGCLYEFYDSADRLSPSRFSRKGPNIRPYDIRVRMQCIRDYGWTATLFADLLLRMRGPSSTPPCSG